MGLGVVVALFSSHWKRRCGGQQAQLQGQVGPLTREDILLVTFPFAL